MKKIIKKICDELNSFLGGSLCESSILIPFIIAGKIYENDKNYVFVVQSEDEAQKIKQKVDVILEESEEKLFYLPSLSDEPYSPIPPHVAKIEKRAEVLSKIAFLNRVFLILSVQSALFKVLKKGFLRNSCLFIEKGKEFNLMELRSFLWEIGFKKRELVEGPGEYSIRGSLLDIFPVDAEKPFRVEFFGDVVESIRIFDPLTQRSFGETDESLFIFPLSEVIRFEELISDLKGELEKCGEFGSIRMETLERINYYQTLEIEARYNDKFFVPISSFLENAEFVAFSKNIDTIFKSERTRLREQFNSSLRPYFLSPERLFVREEELEKRVKKYQTKELRVERISLIPSRVNENIEKLKFLVKEGFRVVITFTNEITLKRVKDLILKEDFTLLRDEKSDEYLNGFYLILNGELGSFSLTDLKWVLVSEKDLVGSSGLFFEKEKSKREIFFEGLRDLKEGDYVVHIEHGIGIYKGLKPIKREDKEEDFIEIEYEGGAKLLIPVERMDLIQKYKGSEGYKPKLDRLGTLNFKKRKEKAKDSVREIAEELLQIYAVRKKSEGSPCYGDPVLEEEFERLFPYELTRDQEKAWEEVKKDLESSIPMDRIICGDVGFGKTEIAMRAAFKVAISKKQVAILCPTTVLALQHFENFKERFSLFPVNIEMLSSLVDKKRQREILKGIETQMVDIVIGTHRILSKDVKFQNLGLLIVDEEQRFGVLHKEKLKKLKPNVHFLMLTATPIPRTLQMGLSSIFDMSLIETPPKDRLSVETIFCEYDEELIKSAIRRELNREGQVFYLYNRIEDIENRARKLKELVPEAKIMVAHGQLKKEELEKRITRFYKGEANILVTTTIIENGVDIKRANTLIVENAHTFGLTELYQIRGRIGRSNIEAYAFLLVPPLRTISKEALERLRTLEEFTELGSGFRIAAIDLELRGAGRLLGKEQSGHIDALGFELYMRLLEEAVSEIKGIKFVEPFRTEFRLKMDQTIPQDYIFNDDERLSIYRELALCRNEEDVDKVEMELKDRYGKPPNKVINLLLALKLKLKAEKMMIKKILETDKKVLITFDVNSNFNRELLFKYINKRGNCSLMDEQTIAFELNDRENGLDFLQEFFDWVR